MGWRWMHFADKKNNTYISTFTCGSLNFIKKMQTVLEDNIAHFKCSLVESHLKRKNSVYYLRIAPNSTRRLKAFMYPQTDGKILMMKNIRV